MSLALQVTETIPLVANWDKVGPRRAGMVKMLPVLDDIYFQKRPREQGEFWLYCNDSYRRFDVHV
jgi:hypothetical protein